MNSFCGEAKKQRIKPMEETYKTSSHRRWYLNRALKSKYPVEGKRKEKTESSEWK